MRNFEKELTIEPNLEPGWADNQAPGYGGSISAWDSLSSVPFAGSQGATVAIDPQKAQRKTALLRIINYAIIMVIYEQKRIDGTIASINRAISGTPSGHETKLLNDCRIAAANLQKVLSVMYRCRESANNISTVRENG